MPLLLDSIQKSGHGTWIEIRLDRLQANLKNIQKSAGPGTQILAVVKANAYGHGLLEISRALGNQVNYLGVSSIYEALELKEHGIETPIFLFGRLLGPEIVTAVKTGLTLSVSSFEESREISEISQSLVRKTLVHIKVDTGMGRLGVSSRQAVQEIQKMAGLPGIILDGIFTHFPTAEAADGFTEHQVEDFSMLLAVLKSKGIEFRLTHTSNSSGHLRQWAPLMNMVRPGLLLYGIYPHSSLKGAGSFAPILSLKSRIILIKQVQPGDSVGYGRSFVASRPTYIATLPIGYSHGYPFHLSNRSWVLYRGKKYPVAGRVSMDYLTIDLGDTPAQIGDEVTLLGEDGGESITADDLASWSGTIPYEIVTRLTARIPRFYQA